MKMIRYFLVFLFSFFLFTLNVPGEEKKNGKSAADVIKHTIKESTIQEAIEKFKEMRACSQNKYSFDESEFNRLGYWLISKGKIKKAIAVFNMNISMFPESANVYDSLGEAYLYSGDKNRAIINYKKSLEINPENGGTRYTLKHIDMQFEIFQGETRKVYRYSEGEHTNLKGPYLGQKPPGLKGEVFAPGIVSTFGNFEFCCTFSADGKEIYFNRRMTIMVCRWEKDGWAAPEPVKFTGKYRSHEPHITLDDKKLYYGTFRPKPGDKSKKHSYGIWMVQRKKKGWSDPNYLGMGMNVSTTRSGEIYLTDRSGENLESQGIAKVQIVKGRFGQFERQLGGVQSPAPGRFPGRHPCIAPDESFIIFDSYKRPKGGEGALFVCFKKENGSWGDAINLGDNVNTGHNICAKLSPDGKYLFYYANRDIYWVDAKVIQDLRLKE